MVKITAAERTLRFFILGGARFFYRVSTIGMEDLPSGGFLLLPNHITWIDAFILSLAISRPIRFIIDESYYRNAFLHPFFKTIGCIPITPRKAKDAMREAAAKIRAGEIVCVFPEGQLSRSGALLRLQRGYEIIARQAEALVVPVWLDRLWGSIFSFKGGRFFTKWPNELPYKVMVGFGRPLPAESADIMTVREELLKMGEACYSKRPILRGHLARACLRRLRRRPFRTAISDGLDGTSLSRGKLLAVAIALSRHLKKKCEEQRIGIVLPPGRAGMIANLAVVLACKIPVNINFTSARDSIQSAIEQASVRTIISAKLMADRLENFPWTPNVVHLDELLPAMKGAIFGWWIFSLLVTWRSLARILKLPRTGDESEAMLLFTSGSSGKPKGVALTHRNILANVSQFATVLDAKKSDVILASLPFFHSFGCTVALWYPLVEGVRVASYPNPLDAGKIAAVVDRYAVTLMLATPTFLRAYLRKAEPRQLRSLRLLITGAEKLPDELAKAFEARFGKEVLQGYGLTETSPVVSVNLPRRHAASFEESQPSSRLGSVGKLMPGIAAEIRDVDSGKKKSLHDSGMLWLRGPNIFGGYLDAPAQTAEVLEDGWFKTGDIGRFDEDGFLYIEGRLSRFSKIGGEMVPHEIIEQKIISALQLDEQSERVLAIVGVSDETKGEALVLLSAIEIDLAQLLPKLHDAGMPNLWIPKRIKRVASIPVLASGKVDLARCNQLAESSP